MNAGRAQLAMRALGIRLRTAWRWLRQATGDDAYERYIAHHAACHADQPVPTRALFYAERQRRKWAGVSRCC